MEKQDEKDLDQKNSSAPGDQDKSGDGKPEDGDVDYKAELEKERALRKQKEDQLKKAEYKLTEKDKEERRKKKEDENTEDDESDNDEKSEDVNDVESIVREKTESLRKDLFDDVVEDTIASLSDNVDEQELIKHFYENRVTKSGFSKKAIREDIELAWTLANRKKLLKRSGELGKALTSERTKNKSHSATGQKSDDDIEIELSPLEKKILSRQGLTAKDVK